MDVKRLFTYHSPNKDQVERINRLRASALAHALLIEELTPHSGEQMLALRALHLASMHANAAIVVNE